MNENSILNVAESWDGFASTRSRRPADWPKRMERFINIMENKPGWGSRVWAAKVEEASGTSDFPLLFADTLDRQMLALWQIATPVMRQVLRVGRLRDFRTAKRFAFEGMLGRLQQVEEQAPYKADPITETKYEITLKKWGKRIGFSWEAFLNDDLGMFSSLPGALVQAAQATEDWRLTSLFWNASGPKDTYFNASKGQKGVSSLPLTVENLGLAVADMCGGKSATSDYSVDECPIINVPRYLMVPPALQLQAEAICMSPIVQWVNASGVAAVAQPVMNALANRRLIPVINPWIPAIVTSGTLAQTTWAVFSETIKPGELGLLANHETPEIFMKASNATALGGMGSDPFSGSYENDVIEYKERYVFEGCTLDPRGGWASDGQ